MAKKKTAGKRTTRDNTFEVASGIAKAEPQGEQQQPAGASRPATAEQKMEEFAEDLGRLLGSAQVKAQGWLNQRKAISEHLTGLRDTANRLLAQLGGVDQGRRSGRPRKVVHFTAPPEKVAAPKKRTMSPEAREKISAAQRKRWAKQKKMAKG